MPRQLLSPSASFEHHLMLPVGESYASIRWPQFTPAPSRVAARTIDNDNTQCWYRMTVVNTPISSRCEDGGSGGQQLPEE